MLRAGIHGTAACRQELEDQNRQLEAEVGELRELRDQEALSGDVKELELELKVRSRDAVHAVHSGSRSSSSSSTKA